MRALALILAALLAGCVTTSPSCAVGVMVLGPVPLPYVDCGVEVEPEDDGEDDDEDEEA